MDKILLLQSLPGFGIVRIKNFLRENSLFLEDEDHLNYLIYLETGLDIKKYYDSVKKIKEDCNNLGVKIISGNNFNISNRPLLLYLKGDDSLLYRRKILSVVGSRNPSTIGINIGSNLINHGVYNNWVIVSGLARGCDTLAHKNCIKLGGETIAVLPMGYNKTLAPWILDRGLFVSEYPPNSRIEKYKCIHRNRIITGLSKVLYVIEAGEYSGSVHSIKFASLKNIPIAYSVGYKGIEKYTTKKITSTIEFDLFLKNCIE